MKNFLFAIIGLVVISFTNCKKFVEIAPPTTLLVTPNVFANSATATAAQLYIYTTMERLESINMTLNTGMLGDELKNYNSQLSNKQLYQNDMTAAVGTGPWISAYSYIYQANNILEGLKNNQAIDAPIAQQLKGESEFVRAFWLFYLTNLYGDIPLVTTTDYTTNATIARTPQAKVYQQIIADLKDAQNVLNTNYIDVSDTTITTERTRPNKWAATALLARVYLFTGDYADAEAQATAVINNSSLYSLCQDLNTVFLANSTEAIWQLAIPKPSTMETYDGYYLILTAGPGGSATKCCALSAQLLNSFDSGDIRRKKWVDSFKTTTTPIVNYYFPYKYQVGSSSSTRSEYVMVLRLAEQYLIRAEARAQQADSSDAKADINVIRNRAGLTNYAGAADKSSLLTAILHERQVELFTEWGHRWLDLIRTGNANSVMSVVTPLKGGSWDSDNHQLLFPIPQTELSADFNLTQNPGY